MKKILLTIVSIISLTSVFAQNVGIGTSTPAQKLQIFGATNTIRIDGVASGNTFNTSPSASTDKLIFVNSLGDLKSFTTGGIGTVLTVDGSGIISWAAPATSGTVTSIGLTLPSEFTVTGSPVTSSGTFTGTWANQTTNKVFAAPNGSTGTPTFRLLTTADIPSGTITANNGLTVSAGNNVQLGGTLTGTTTITTTGFDMIFTGTTSNFGIGVTPTLKLDVNGGIKSRSTGFRAPDGSLGSPSYHFTSDLTTGLYFVAAGKLGVSTTGLERFRFTTVGLSINPAGGVADPVYALDVNASSATNVISGVNTNASGIGVSGINTAASGAGSGEGVFGSTIQSGATSAGVKGQNSNAAWWAIVGLNTAASGAGVGGGVFGQSAQSGTPGAGVYGVNTNINGTGVWGVNSAASGAGIGAGVVGISNQSGAGSGGVYGQSNNASGTGVYGAGQGVSSTGLAAGQGGAFNGLTTGAYIGNTSVGTSQAIYSNNGGVICRVNYWSGATQYKILGTGTVSTTIKDLQGDKVVLHCPETPEIYFSDYGNGQLVNGKAHITLDPIIAKNIVVNVNHPLQVIIQLNGDCKGVFVVDNTRSASGFDVVELQGGTSNVPFTWTITANRADEDFGGKISHNADIRFEPAPKDEEVVSGSPLQINQEVVAKPTTVTVPK